MPLNILDIKRCRQHQCFQCRMVFKVPLNHHFEGVLHAHEHTEGHMGLQQLWDSDPYMFMRQFPSWSKYPSTMIYRVGKGTEPDVLWYRVHKCKVWNFNKPDHPVWDNPPKLCDGTWGTHCLLP